MIVTAGWVALLLAVLGLAAYAQRSASRLARLSDLVVAAARRRVGVLLVVGAWAFVGLHVFARYTKP